MCVSLDQISSGPGKASFQNAKVREKFDPCRMEEGQFLDSAGVTTKKNPFQALLTLTA
jgi:hypothetical protein